MIDQYTYQIPPGGYQALSVAGDMIAVTASTGRVVIRTDSGERMELDAGQQWRPDPKANGLREQFPGLTLNNPGSDEMTVTVAIGSGEFLDLRFTSSGQIGVQDANTGDSFSDIIGAVESGFGHYSRSDIVLNDAQVSSLLGAIAGLRRVVFRNDGPGYVRVSPTEARDGRGLIVDAGEKFSENGRNVLYVHSYGPVSLSVNYFIK